MIVVMMAIVVSKNRVGGSRWDDSDDMGEGNLNRIIDVLDRDASDDDDEISVGKSKSVEYLLRLS